MSLLNAIIKNPTGGGICMSHRSRPTVLLFEADTSLRRLIALGLEYRGMRVIEAGNLSTIEAQKLDLLILDVDGKRGSDWSLVEVAQAHPYLSTLPVVVLTWECPITAGVASEEYGYLQAHTTCLTKPFDARALHTTIEELLAVVGMASEAAKRQEILLAGQIGQVASPAPSIWPLLTAVGLLLAFIGLMGVFALTAIGLSIVLVSLLWWTLGTGVRKEAVAIT
jgi:CheY-like chemotaxis protein